jgi:hypothetical protein
MADAGEVAGAVAVRLKVCAPSINASSSAQGEACLALACGNDCGIRAEHRDFREIVRGQSHREIRSDGGGRRHGGDGAPPVIFLQGAGCYGKAK